jgi:hypothetical protein
MYDTPLHEGSTGKCVLEISPVQEPGAERAEAPGQTPALAFPEGCLIDSPPMEDHRGDRPARVANKFELGPNYLEGKFVPRLRENDNTTPENLCGPK